MKNALVVVGCLVITIGAWVVYESISLNNREVRLRNLAANSEKNTEQVFAQGWLKVKGVAKVNKSQEETLKEVFDKAMRRGVSDRTLASALTEAKIEIPSNTYERVQTVIEEFRNKFQGEQTKLLDIKNEHDNLIATWPGTWFVRNTSPVEVTIVTSEQAKDAYATGEDNNSDPYKKD